MLRKGSHPTREIARAMSRGAEHPATRGFSTRNDHITANRKCLLDPEMGPRSSYMKGPKGRLDRLLPPAASNSPVYLLPSFFAIVFLQGHDSVRACGQAIQTEKARMRA
ncbi:hypothetical protein MTO96_027029 [Rhipicephalus appendiculatus]